MLYLQLISFANVLIIAGNLLATFPFTLEKVGESVVSSVFGTVAVIAVDGITAFLIRRLPQRYFSAEHCLPKIPKWEKTFYRKIKIKAWKDKVPELGGFTGFHKDKVQSYTDREYLARFILESNYGIVIHIVNGLCGFVILWFPICGNFSVGLPVAMVNLLLSLMPAAILRYHLPALTHLYRKSQKEKAVI